MQLNQILLLVLLIIYPVIWYFGSYSKVSVIEKPLIFHNKLFVLFGNLITIAFIGMSIYLIFVSWKTFLLLILIITISGLFTGYLKKKI